MSVALHTEVRRRQVPSRPRGPGTGDWTRLVHAIEICRACPLGTSREHVVVYRGSPRPRFVFVGEAPGRAEDRAGLPFVGRSGQRLDRAIAAVGLEPGDFGILNVVKCHPPGNRLPSRSVKACRPHLDRQLDLLRPLAVVTLGAHALRALRPDAAKVTLVAGTPLPGAPFAVFPLLHPAATLRSKSHAVRWERDLGRLARWISTQRV